MPETVEPAVRWTVTRADQTPESGAATVWMAAPVPDAAGRLVFSGCIGPGGRVRIRHGGAVLADLPACPGFQVAVPLRPGSYEILADLPEDRRLVWEVRDSGSEAYVMTGMLAPPQSGPDAVAPGEPFALAGRMGQLFLGGDSNDSIGQFTESRSLTERNAAGWSNTFRQFPGWRKIHGLARLSLLIAPAKEEILREYYPLPRGARTILDDFVTRFRDPAPILPKWELWNRRDLAWSRTDTHWTDYGAAIAAAAVLKAWGLPSTGPDSGLPETWRLRQRIGDLGSKVQPQVASHELTFLPEVPARLVFDNGVTNQGNIRLYRHPQAPQPGRLLIFGDSFGTNLAEAFSGVFAEVAYAYQPAGFDPELVAAVRPDHVLLQITQRFLHGQPATGKPVFAKARDKIAALPQDKRAALLARLAAAPAEFAPLTAPLIAPVPDLASGT